MNTRENQKSKYKQYYQNLI